VTFSYSIDEAKKLAYVTFPEKSGLVESLEVIRQVSADERLSEDFGVLVDARATRFAPTTQEARAIASVVSDPTLFSRHLIAVVVSEMVQYGMTNMIALLAGLNGATIRVFYEVEEAEVWLRVGHEWGRE
jgi:hypothetical protein